MDDASRDVLYSRDTARRKIRAEGQRLSKISQDRWERSQRRWEILGWTALGLVIVAAGISVGLAVTEWVSVVTRPAPHVLRVVEDPPVRDANGVVWVIK